MAEYTPKNTKKAMTTEEINAAVNGYPITNEVVSWADLSLARWLAASDAERQSLQQVYRDYYDGEIGFELSERMLEFFELDGATSYSFNFIPLAIDIINERMAIDYFDVAGEDEDTPDEKRQGGKDGRFMEWFDFSRMDANQDDVHHDMLVDDESFTIVEWDDDAQMPIMTEHPAYVSTQNDGSGDGIYVAMREDDQSKIKFAVRAWRIETGPDRGKQRLNVYTDDGIHKFITGGGKGAGGYVMYTDKEGDAWPLPWINPKTKKPIGMPIVRFSIRDSLVKALVSFQDSINKTAVDEMAGADIEGFSMITLSGGEAPVNDDGTSSVEIGPRRILHAPDGQWGSIGAGDLAGLAMMTDKAIQRLFMRGRIPLKYIQITGQVSSSDSQNADDSGMVSMIEAIARRAGNSWEDVMEVGRNVNNAFCPRGEELDDGRISAKWKSFERIDREAASKAAAETNEIKARTFDSLIMNNVPRHQAALMAGYTEEEAAQMVEVERSNLGGEITQ